MDRTDIGVLLGVFSAVDGLFGPLAAALAAGVAGAVLACRAVAPARVRVFVTQVIELALDDDQARRWGIVAGHKGQGSTAAWVVETIDGIVAAERPGRINPLIPKEQPPVPRPPRYCQFCAQELKPYATQRRRYCDDRCRVAAWRERKARG